jgi:tetratricopeptide (TPR) repeat protein
MAQRIVLFVVVLCFFLFFVSSVYAQTDSPPPEPPMKSSAEYCEDGDKAFKEGRFDEAIKSFSLAIKSKPDDYSPYYKRAALYLSRGQTKKALTDLNKVLELKPDFSQVNAERKTTNKAFSTLFFFSRRDLVEPTRLSH